MSCRNLTPFRLPNEKRQTLRRIQPKSGADSFLNCASHLIGLIVLRIGSIFEYRPQDLNRSSSQKGADASVDLAAVADGKPNGYLTISPYWGARHAVNAVRRVFRGPGALLMFCRVASVVGERASAVSVSACPRRPAASVC